MGLQDKITQADAVNLKIIKKKLKLPMKKLAQATSLSRDTTLTDEEKVRILLDIPEGVTTLDFLNERLSPSEIETIGKFVNLEKVLGENS
jgi:hypothetical protein